MKHVCEGCGANTWPGQDLCPDCELRLKERRFDESQEGKEDQMTQFITDIKFIGVSVFLFISTAYLVAVYIQLVMFFTEYLRSPR